MGFTREMVDLHKQLLVRMGGCRCKMTLECHDVVCSSVVQAKPLEYGDIVPPDNYVEFLVDILNNELRGYFSCHQTGFEFPIGVKKDE